MWVPSCGGITIVLRIGCALGVESLVPGRVAVCPRAPRIAIASALATRSHVGRALAAESPTMATRDRPGRGKSSSA